MFAILSNFFRFSLQGLNKSAESFSAFRRTLVNAGILENADEDLSDLFFQDIIDVFLIDVRVIRKELIHPVRMLFDISVGADILLVQDVILQKLHLLFQTGRKDRKTHYLDKADVLLLDVMAVLMRMVNAQRIFPGRDVVPEGQIQLKGIAHFSGNRSDGVVGLAVCLGKNKGSLIGVASPCL